MRQSPTSPAVDLNRWGQPPLNAVCLGYPARRRVRASAAPFPRRKKSHAIRFAGIISCDKEKNSPRRLSVLASALALPQPIAALHDKLDAFPRKPPLVVDDRTLVAIDIDALDGKNGHHRRLSQMSDLVLGGVACNDAGRFAGVVVHIRSAHIGCKTTGSRAEKLAPSRRHHSVATICSLCDIQRRDPGRPTVKPAEHQRM